MIYQEWHGARAGFGSIMMLKNGEWESEEDCWIS